MARWHGWGGACMAALVLGAAPAAGQSSQSWTWCVNRNRVFPTDTAIRGCTAVIQSGREDQRNLAIAFNNRGLAYYGKGDYETAIADLTQAVKLDPDYADAFQSRASAYSDKGDHAHAIADYDQSIRLNSHNPIAYNNRCDEQLIVGQVKAALADCDEALRQRPNHANTLMHRGNAHLAAHEFADALADYDAALKLNSRDAWSLYGRGYAKAQQGDIGTADMETAKSIQANIAAGFESRGIK